MEEQIKNLLRVGGSLGLVGGAPPVKDGSDNRLVGDLNLYKLILIIIPE